MKTITNLLTAVFALISTMSLNAQTFEMVKDINHGNLDSTPEELTPTDNYLFFRATIEEQQGQMLERLWKTDGTEAGTTIIYGGQENLINPRYMVSLNGVLYFSAASEYDGSELWKTDGNSTQLVKNINLTTYAGSNPQDLTIFNNKIYFSADNGTSGRELWVTDGTSAGTQMLIDLTPFSIKGTPVSSSPKEFFEFNGKLYFGVLGRILFETDGTPQGTQEVKTISNITGTQPVPFSIEQFTEYNGKLYFSAYDETNGYELWVTDGTTTGTQLFKDINPNGSGYAYGFTEYNGKLYFNADDGTNGDELWVTDGTSAGTHLLKDINPNGDGDPYGFTEYNGKLYFSADDGTNGDELWVTDGTTAGTQLFKDINPNGSSFPHQFIKYNGLLYFKADNEINGNELWVTDGTSTGTQVIQPAVSPNNDPLAIKPFFTIFDGSLYFSANYDSNGQELWKLTTPNMSVKTEKLATINIHPNPVENVLHIETHHEINSLKLYSITGQHLQTWQNQTKINLTTYAKGIYFLQIQTPGGVKTEKIIKK